MKKFIALFFTLLFFASSIQAKDLRFVQISDVRYSEASNNPLLTNLIEKINKQKNIDFVVFTGDNIQKPNVSDLEAFLNEIKKLKCPYYIVIGDKDVNKMKHLSKVEYVQYLKKNIKKYKPETAGYTFENKKVIFIVADGAKDVIPSTSGYYRDDELSRIDSELVKYSKKNVIMLQHFPVIPPVEKETYYTYKSEKYLETIEKHNNVKAVISGHYGVNSEKNVNGIVHITTEGFPYYRIIDVLDIETNHPAIWAQLKQAE